MDFARHLAVPQLDCRHGHLAAALHRGRGKPHYIKFARAKGLSQNYIMVRHVFRNAIVPIAINFPSDILLLISGGLITESLYSVPGMGGLLIQSIRALDNNLVQVLVLIFSTLSVFGVFLGDIFVSFVDPRIKLTADPQ